MDLLNHELDRPRSSSDENISTSEKDSTSRPTSTPILAKGPVIQVISKKCDHSGLGHGLGAAQYEEKSIQIGLVSNLTIKPEPDYSDLQMITTKEEFEKLYKENSNLGTVNNQVKSINNTSSRPGKLINQATSQMESSECNINVAKQDRSGYDEQICSTDGCSSNQNNLSLKEVSSEACSLDKLDDCNRPRPKSKSLKGSKSDSGNAMSSGPKPIKAKSKDSVHPHVKSKFNPGSLQFIRQAISGIIFSGWIGEREYVDKIKAYRDIIEVDECEETFNQKLKAIVCNISGVKEQTNWINITAPCGSPCYHLWVLLDSAPFPGHYWFQIEDVIVENQFGLRIIVKILREIQPFDGESFSKREKRIKGDINISTEEWKNWLLAISDLNFKDAMVSMLTIFTPSNLNSLFRLTVVLCVTLVVAFVKFLQESWHFMLKFLRELGIFVHHATPFLQSVLNFIEKLIGGFYILLAMLYRDLRRPSHPHPPPPPFEFRHLPIGPPETYSQFPVQRRTAQSVKYVPPQSWVYKND